MSAVPDFALDPNAVLQDTDAAWRHGAPPGYSNTRKVFEESKQTNHESGSLEAIVIANIVKNWEIEASFKPSVSDWRTVDPEKYSFSMNGGEPRPAEHMLKVGTYNAILTESNFYSPANNDFESSHKTFKRMMPTFAWEVLEVYSGPPKVAFKWRHWGVMKNDYVGYNEKKQKVRVKAHGGLIDIQGVTVATVNDGLKVEKLETWFDPLAMFKQVSKDSDVIVEEDSV
ncbi:hypothetical protein POJ06DRAFT_199528 [Lipomyces tetrasporus]|uniref:Pathogen-related protein n=1 Tax=Lipomyces tetrasporus TaxID=54092 RepID=A0AAD7QNY2_9ASCO|nr:uncharacterized protein POJ06DRAFT_199528 [Lipomyces tetrasporus]KAJ8098583.1 hypothetical protein POJ06DRAFT_199528 [Lipomyces tetrasporus]